MSYPYIDRKPAILAELRKRAQVGQTITYGEMGGIVNMPPQGPWGAVLDDIGADERRARRPDIACLVVRKATGWPGQVKGAEALEAAKAERQAVFDHHKG